PQRGVDKVTLRGIWDRRNDIQMDLGHRPPRRDVLHRDGGGGINLSGAVAGLPQFVGQSYRKAASVSSRNQLRRVGVSARFKPRAKKVRGFLQDSARGGDGPFAVVTGPQPNDR